MLRFYWGTVGSGKSLNLISRYLDRKRKNPESTILIKPAFDTRTEGVYTRFGNVSVSPDLVLESGSKATLELLNKLRNIKYIFIDEIQFVDLEQIKIISKLDQNKHQVEVYGLRTDYLGKMWPQIEFLMSAADQIIYLESDCELCKQTRATYNLKTEESETEIGFHYAGVCRNCYLRKNSRILYE